MKWEIKQIEEICTIVTSGGTPKSTTSSFYYPKEVPWLKTGEVNYCRIYDTETYISKEGLARSSAKLIPENSVIVAMYGNTAGRVAINKIQICTNQACCNLVINHDIADYQYVYYVLSNMYDKLVSLKNGAAQLNLNARALKAFEISFPDIETQKKIGQTLSAYDDLIENNQKQIKLLEEAAQRLYKEWFVDFRFPGYEDTKFIDGIPEGWRKAKLNDVLAKITTGLNPRKNFVLGSGENYYVTIKNMKDNNIYLDDKCDRIDDEALIKINKRSDLQKGDILFSGIGTMGRVYLIGIPTDNWNVSESVFTMRANDNISKEMLYLLLLSPDMQGYCDTHAHGVAQRGIRMADIKNYQFYLPVSEIIENFTNNAKPFTKKIQILQRQNILLTQARDRLLPKLMSGEIEV